MNMAEIESSDTASTAYRVSRRVPSVDSVQAPADFQISGYGIAFTGEASGPISIKSTSQRGAAPKENSCHPSVITPEMRASFRQHWRTALSAVDRMIEATKNVDPMSLFTATDDLEACLAKLWALRAIRNVDWQTILNHAQGMLRQAFLESRVESLTTEQCTSIRELVDRHLGPATKSIVDLNEAIRLISDAGFDPYFAISGDPQE